tara:strand:- start:410 stop:535 length:126 start_codon:yes stop_codon:yes gene_type:complete
VKEFTIWKEGVSEKVHKLEGKGACEKIHIAGRKGGDCEKVH